MPTNMVHTEGQEKDWRRAKAIAAKSGHKENWPYVVSIYKSLQGKQKAATILKQAYAIHPSLASGIILNTIEKRAFMGAYELPALRWFDRVIRHAPDFLKPMLQKVVVKIKYPELYGVLEHQLQSAKYKAKSKHSLVRALLGQNRLESRGWAGAESNALWNLARGPNTPRGSFGTTDADLFTLLGLGRGPRL